MPSLRKAFTIAELLAVAAIVTILASLGFYVARAAIGSARTTSAEELLHQNQLALSLYRADYEPVSEFGTNVDQGLPSDEQLTLAAIYGHPIAGIGRERLTSPCGTEINVLGDRLMDIDYYPSTEVDYVKHSKKRGANSIIFADFGCGPYKANAFDSMSLHFGIAVTLDGTLLHRQAYGTAMTPEWFYGFTD
jgi:type II secretory pathway pseudopilin PulG